MGKCNHKNCPRQYGTVPPDCDIKDCQWRTEDVVWVKVVRCKECVHWLRTPWEQHHNEHEKGLCIRLEEHRPLTAENDFCSYGERRSE